jgi:hypothetical protein
VPGSSGPIRLRNTPSPPTEMASSPAPWNESHVEMVLNLPVARRASFKAMPIALVPPGVKSTLFRSPGASSASFLASRMATGFVKRRGRKGSSSSWLFIASIT